MFGGKGVMLAVGLVVLLSCLRTTQESPVQLTSEYCSVLDDSFRICTAAALKNGSCKVDSSTGYLAFCPSCLQGYEGWIDCHCNLMTTSYGLGQCHPYCSVFFWCAARMSFNKNQCAKELNVLQSCMKNNTISIPSSPLATQPGDFLPKQRPLAIPKLTKEFIFQTAPIAYSHACSIVEKPNGDIVATFAGGPAVSSPQDGIWYSIRDSRSGKWTPPAVAIKIPGICSMNPSLFQNSQGKLYLMFHSGGALDGSGTCNFDRWTASYVTSTDGGKTWNQTVVPLPEGYQGGIKNKCIQISNGDVLCPASTQAVINELIKYWRSHIEITDANLGKWKKANFINFNYANTTNALCVYEGVIQPTLFEISPGKIMALLRSGCRVIAQSWSNDFGKTWDSTAAPISLPNPNAGIDGVVMKGQPDLGMVLAFNNDPQHRTPLSVGQSFDGKTWTRLLDIENDPSGSFEYPTMIQSQINPRKAHVCYTHTVNNKHVMAFATLDWSRATLE